MRAVFIVFVTLAALAACSFDTGLHVSEYNPNGHVTLGPAIIEPGTVADDVGGSDARDAREEAARAENGDVIDDIVEDSAVGGQLTIGF
ncbi:MAG: hypothetical protein AAFY56_15165 [Pseudomonadota bacterium]